jgi:hypothetical protein
VLGVTTLELCHPLVLVILMIPNDPTFGGHSTKMERFVSQVNAVPAIRITQLICRKAACVCSCTRSLTSSKSFMR